MENMAKKMLTKNRQILHFTTILYNHVHILKERTTILIGLFLSEVAKYVENA